MQMLNDASPKRRKVIFQIAFFSPESDVPCRVLGWLLEASEHRAGKRFDYFLGSSPVRRVVMASRVDCQGPLCSARDPHGPLVNLKVKSSMGLF